MKWFDGWGWHHLVGEGKSSDIKGKYLFFSKDQGKLRSIAETEFANHGFFRAKVSIKPSGGDYVLCLYWFDDSRKHELHGRYKDDPSVKYRYWKSDAATLRGEYSPQHLENVTCIDDENDEDRPY